MGRLLLLLFWGLVVYVLIRYWLTRKPPQVDRPRVGSDTMVPCAHCGLNVPEQEAVVDQGIHYCSSEHRRLGPRRGH